MKIRTYGFALAGGILFAAFDRCGYMLKQYGSIFAVSENPWHRTVFHRILLRLPVSVAVVLVLFLAADRLVLKAGRLRERQAGSGPDSFRGSMRWFGGMWLLYFVSFLPAFLGGYPGIFAADAPNQVGWTFSGWLTAHHPLLHTGVLCGIFSLGRCLGLSDTSCAAVYTVLQMLALAGIFAWISRFLKLEKAPVWLRAGTAIYLCLLPFHGMMAVYTTKDTLFAGVFVLCLIQFFKMCTRPEEYFRGYRFLVSGGCCFVLLFLLRNNGFHTLLLSIPFLLTVLFRYWKKVLLLSVCLLLVYQIYNGPVLTLVRAEPGNAREALSVIMQTLGRTYTAGGDIRPEEMEVIRPVLSEETLALYTPDLSDPLKNHFHTEAFQENPAGFLKTWLQIGFRNKKLYIDAFLNTTAAFWYPGTDGEYLDFVCFDIEKDNPAYPHVSMQPVSAIWNRYYTAIGTDAVFRRIPVIRELLSMGFYFWLMVFAVLYVCRRREYIRFVWMLPFWAYMATNFLGPAALLRYAYPVMAGAPFLIYLLLTPLPSLDRQ